jgi:hypothetical protein
MRNRRDSCIYNILKVIHHQPINAPTAGAQALLMDYLQGQRAITHHAGPGQLQLDQRLNVPSEARSISDNKF